MASSPCIFVGTLQVSEWLGTSTLSGIQVGTRVKRTQPIVGSLGMLLSRHNSARRCRSDVTLILWAVLCLFFVYGTCEQDERDSSQLRQIFLTLACHRRFHGRFRLGVCWTIRTITARISNSLHSFHHCLLRLHAAASATSVTTCEGCAIPEHGRGMSSPHSATSVATITSSATGATGSTCTTSSDVSRHLSY